MQNIETIMKELGIEIPADQKEELNKKVSENYVTKAEHDKKVSRVEADRDNWKSKAETATETLKGFDGVDVEAMNKSISDWKKKAEDAEKEYAEKLYERDFTDALKNELAEVEFTSEAAKRSVIADIKASDVKLKDGKIIGLNDVLDIIKEKDASAFVDESQKQAEKNKAKFTQQFQKGSGTGGALTKEDFKAMSLDKRLKLKAEQPELYESLK